MSENKNTKDWAEFRFLIAILLAGVVMVLIMAKIFVDKDTAIKTQYKVKENAATNKMCE